MMTTSQQKPLRRALAAATDKSSEKATPMQQQDYLRAAKDELEVRWDDLAEMAGIAPRALKTYRLPDASADHRGMPNLARRSIDQLLAEHRRKAKRGRKAAV